MPKSRVPPKIASNRIMISRAETRKRERGSRKQTRKGVNHKSKAVQFAQSSAFVDLCNADIMNTSLEFVEHKSWLSKGKVNIFIIGEVHSYRNYEEVGIFEMFEQLVGKIKDRDTFVDILLEISEGTTNRDVEFYMRTPELPDAESRQLENVRDLFRRCIGKHNCGKIRVHWVDNMEFSTSSTYKTPNKFIPWHLTSVRTALDAMPEWLINFYRDYNNHKYDNDYYDIDTSFQDRFQRDEDLLKLLDENTIVLKEIDKAANVQLHEETIFNREFARTILIELIQSWTDDVRGYKGKIYDTARTVMDLYTVARMIKSNMKNVIIYVGGFHAENIVFILRRLGYIPNEIIERVVGPVIRIPISTI